jgi:type II secretory pathway pseudopilin PulG
MRSRARGFTYLWMLLAVALISVGLALTLELDSTVAARDREAELLRVGHEFRNAIGRYHELQVQGGAKQYPASLDDLLKDNRFPTTRRHLRRVHIDPMTRTDEWGLVKINGRIVGVHSLSQRKASKQEGFAPEDVSFAGKERVSEWVFTYPAQLSLEGQPLPSDPAASQPSGPRATTSKT